MMYSNLFLLLPGLHKLSQAEEYLAQAQWTVLKTPDCSSAIKSKLERNLGLLYAAQGNFEESLRHLADDVRLVLCVCGWVCVCVWVGGWGGRWYGGKKDGIGRLMWSEGPNVPW